MLERTGRLTGTEDDKLAFDKTVASSKMTGKTPLSVEFTAVDIPTTVGKPSNPKDRVGVSKPPMSVVPTLVLMEVGVAMLEGCKKYGAFNFRGVGVRGSIYYDATMRHLMAWWEGQDIDPDSGLNHITKAITSLVVLRDAMLMDKFTDDRPPRMEDLAEFLADLNAKSAKLIETYGHIQPKHYTHLREEDELPHLS